MITLTEVETFLDRPNGGMEVEIIYAGIELFVAGVLMLSGQSVLNVSPFKDLYWYVPHYELAIMWMCSGCLTYSGLLLYRRGNIWCAPLRWFGAFLSAGLWFWVLRVVVGDTPFDITQAIVTGVAGFGAIWQFRIMTSAWRRQKRHWTTFSG